MKPDHTQTALFHFAFMMLFIIGSYVPVFAGEPIRSDSTISGKTDLEKKSDTTSIYTPESDIDKEYYLKANDAIYYLYLGQKAFGTQEYRNTLLYAGKSLNIETSAEALGLLGSAHYFLGDTEKAKLNWQKAIELEKKIPVPEYIVPLVANVNQSSQ